MKNLLQFGAGKTLDLPTRPRISDAWPISISQPAGKPISSAVPHNGLRVLVVDDERALADLVGSYLT